MATLFLKEPFAAAFGNMWSFTTEGKYSRMAIEIPSQTYLLMQYKEVPGVSSTFLRLAGGCSFQWFPFKMARCKKKSLKSKKCSVSQCFLKPTSPALQMSVFLPYLYYVLQKFRYKKKRISQFCGTIILVLFEKTLSFKSGWNHLSCRPVFSGP